MVELQLNGEALSLAHAAQQDPVEFRIKYLREHPRHLGVLQAVAKAAGWGSSAAGRHQGVAVHESFSSYAAQVVELSEGPSGYKIERVVCAVPVGHGHISKYRTPAVTLISVGSLPDECTI